jgi:hypothetical protein
MRLHTRAVLFRRAPEIGQTRLHNKRITKKGWLVLFHKVLRVLFSFPADLRRIRLSLTKHTATVSMKRQAVPGASGCCG